MRGDRPSLREGQVCLPCVRTTAQPKVVDWLFQVQHALPDLRNGQVPPQHLDNLAEGFAKSGDGMKRAVFLYYLGSGRTVRVTPPEYCANSASWSAGGKIVFSAHQATAGGSGASDMYRMAAGGKPELVLKDAESVSASR